MLAASLVMVVPVPASATGRGPSGPVRPVPVSARAWSQSPAAITVGACASAANVKSFRGSESISLNQSVSGPDNSGGTVNVILSHSADITFSSVVPVGGPSTFQGQTTAPVAVHDTYTDTDSSGKTTGEQVAKGAATVYGGIVVSGCQYAASFGFVTATTVTSPGSRAQPGSLNESVNSGPRPLPAVLQLSGRATVNVYCAHAILPLQGGYLLGTNNFDYLYCGAHGSGQGQPVGKATISWHFYPTNRPPARCSIGTGGTTASAGPFAARPIIRTQQQSGAAVACELGPAVIRDVYTQADKEAFKKQYGDLLKDVAKACGVDTSDPLTLIDLLAHTLGSSLILVWDPCRWVGIQIHHLLALIKDPPGTAVSVVALPVVPRSKSVPARCTLGASTCRRGGGLALAYVRALGQVTAAEVALATSLDRLGSAPAAPEDLAANPPQYSLRLQAAAAMLYSGLLAAWCERLRTASANMTRFLVSLGGVARRAAGRVPPVQRPSMLWETYHHMNVYGLAQLTEDLLSQEVEVPLRAYAKHHPSAAGQTAAVARQLASVHGSLESDLNAIVEAQGQAAVSAATRRFVHDASSIGVLRGLRKYAPNASMTAELLAFAAGGLTKGNPVALTAP